jgi:hypothetical protein
MFVFLMFDFGQETFAELPDNYSQCDVDQMYDTAIRHMGITRKWNEKKKTTHVRVYEYRITGGKTRVHLWSDVIDLPIEDMSDTEFSTELQKLLSTMPAAFQVMFAVMARKTKTNIGRIQAVQNAIDSFRESFFDRTSVTAYRIESFLDEVDELAPGLTQAFRLDWKFLFSDTY